MNHKQFKYLGVSFKYAPIAVRESIALSKEDTLRLTQYVNEIGFLSDFLVLSTCNRTEVYYSAEEDRSHELLTGLAMIKGLERELLEGHLVNELDSDVAVKHLFEVSLGLDAQVVGDIQIINQVKNAYQMSADEGLVGPFLHRLMHTIFYANKRVVQETAFRDGAASVSYAAKELVEELTREFQEPRILILGIGEIGEDVVKNLVGTRFKDVTIVNRTESKAKELAALCGFKSRSYDHLYDVVQHSDVIISSVSTNEPLITQKHLDGVEILSHKYFIDLSVPRSVGADVENVHGVLLYNIDDIQSKASKTLEKRMAAIPDVQLIVNESVNEFAEWSQEMLVSPTIKKLKNALEDIRSEEISRFLKGADNDEMKLVEKVTKSMMQKVMKLPVLQLKAACKRGEADTLIDVLNDLFDLEKQSTNVKR